MPPATRLLRPTQHPTLNGTGNKQGAASVLCGRKGNHRSGSALAMSHALWYIYLQDLWPKKGR